MKRELKILLALVVVILAGVAVANRLYRSDSETTSPGAAAGAGNYGMNFREELIRADSHARGPENAALTIVEFLDPECEACKAFHPVMKQFLSENEGRIRFVVRYMAFHTSSRMAIAAAEAAGLQGKYWEMLDTLFETAGEWGHKPQPVPTFFETYARSLGLDEQKFKDDLVDQRWNALADRDMADGKTLGVKGTPTVFLNGEMLTDLSSEGLRAMAVPMMGTSKP